jgi:uncharacterized protein
VTVQRPLPVPDERSEPFWTAAARHKLVLARCSRCGQLTHPPGLICPECHHPEPDYTFEEISGGGTIRSWIVLHQSFLPGYDDELPYVLVDISLDVDPNVRLIGQLLDGTDEALAVSQRVDMVFDDIAPDVAVPAFTLVTA